MNKKKKLFINLILIVIALAGIYHFGGFYVSKDQCVKEYLRGMHIDAGEAETSIKEGNVIYTIFTNDETFNVESDAVSPRGHLVVVTQKIGFLYRAKSLQESTGEKNNVTVSCFKTPDEKGYVVVAERIKEDIAKAEVMVGGVSDVFNLTFEEWNNNVGVTYIESEGFVNLVNYKTYDEAGNLIEDFWGN